MGILGNKIVRSAGLVIEYCDPLEGFNGWLVIDDPACRLCAGGMRVQKGITKEHVTNMARNMTMKMRICGLPIGGAKCGIDYDHTSPGKIAAMTRFMAAIRPYIQTCYSMGPDLNTDMNELETIAADLQIPSIKMAIAAAQGMNLTYFQERYSILSQEIHKDWSLGRIRAGYGVAAAALATLAHLRISPARATFAVQGFGTLAKAAILGLIQAGVKITAVADAEKSLQISANNSVVIDDLLREPGTLLPTLDESSDIQILNSSAILSQPCDILLLAAIENAVTVENASLIKAKAVVPGANLAVSHEASLLLHKRNIPVLPCFLAGCGGSLSMNGLFGPADHPAPTKVLGYIDQKMGSVVQTILQQSEQENISPTEAAQIYCDNAPGIEREKPYEVNSPLTNLPSEKLKVKS
jgi:glutamate dehydrogenase (NAD(P)+)